MAGAFTHFVICDVAKRKRQAIGTPLWQLLNKHSEFLYLGSVSPDLPYLSFKTGKVHWANVMHHEKTNSIAISGYDELRRAWNARTEAEEIKLAWLFGYASHLIADATIHPVVQAIVGVYEQNKEEHRICEMTQDSLIYYMKKNEADIAYAEFSAILKHCKNSEHFDKLMQFWKEHVVLNYEDKGEEPDTKLWFTTFTSAIDVAEGSPAARFFSRHIDIVADYTYKTNDEIRNNYPNYYEKYFQKAKLPNGSTGSFTKYGFDKAVQNLTTAWSTLYTGLSSAAPVVSDIIKNWSLDTGVDMDSPTGEVTYWRET